MSQKPLRWGIISCGKISKDFSTALQTYDSSQHVITTCAARSLDDAKAFAEELNIKNYYDSYDKVYASDEVDIVYVGNINTAHKEACLKAIRAGKHVLVEKPMCLNSIEQEEIFAALRDKQVFFMEAIWTRHFPIINRLREELKQGTIGEVKCVQANFLVNIKDVDRLRKKELGGGAILDIGIYPIQLVCMIFNHEKPIEIIASGHLMDTGVDECATIILKYSRQRMAVVTVSTNCGRHSSAIISGDKGTIQLCHPSWCPDTLILPNGEKVYMPLPECTSKANFLNKMGLRFQAEEARLAIEQGLFEHPNMKHDDSKLIMHIMDEARKQIGYKLLIE